MSVKASERFCGSVGKSEGVWGNIKECVGV